MKRYIIALTEEQAAHLCHPILREAVIKDIIAQTDALDKADSDYRLNLDKED